ncbi:MAG: hypothetical protein ACI8Y7_000922 [Candidatus Woesearchaeota archaeon]|jgi:hypothetical protein
MKKGSLEIATVVILVVAVIVILSLLSIGKVIFQTSAEVADRGLCITQSIKDRIIPHVLQKIPLVKLLMPNSIVTICPSEFDYLEFADVNSISASEKAIEEKLYSVGYFSNPDNIRRFKINKKIANEMESCYNAYTQFKQDYGIYVASVMQEGSEGRYIGTPNGAFYVGPTAGKYENLCVLCGQIHFAPQLGSLTPPAVGASSQGLDITQYLQLHKKQETIIFDRLNGAETVSKYPDAYSYSTTEPQMLVYNVYVSGTNGFGFLQKTFDSREELLEQINIHDGIRIIPKSQVASSCGVYGAEYSVT